MQICLREFWTKPNLWINIGKKRTWAARAAKRQTRNSLGTKIMARSHRKTPLRPTFIARKRQRTGKKEAKRDARNEKKNNSVYVEFSICALLFSEFSQITPMSMTPDKSRAGKKWCREFEKIRIAENFEEGLESRCDPFPVSAWGKSVNPMEITILPPVFSRNLNTLLRILQLW